MAADRCDLLCLDLQVAERLREQRLSPHEAENASGKARALSDPTRLTLAVALLDASELCVCDLAWIAERSQTLVSHHVRALRYARHRPLTARGKDGHVLAHRRGTCAAHIRTDSAGHEAPKARACLNRTHRSCSSAPPVP
jgi:transposase